MRSVLLGLAAFALFGASAHAAEPDSPAFTALDAMLPAHAGNKACYSRTYDAAHLRAHPHQRITAMKFLLGVRAYEPPSKIERAEDRLYYTFTMSVKRRGDKRLLFTGGDCHTIDHISCVVDCDGGGLTLDNMPPAGSLLVRIEEDGILMFHDCEEDEGTTVKPGTDDKVVRLDKTALEACKALQKREGD
jgi:hypothetical protein